MASLTSLDTARLLLIHVIDAGVRDVVLAPGSRSAPLAYALAELEADSLVRVHVRIDERVGGFTALGIALATHRPVAVVTTSGTAVGELAPAVMEASHSGVPLLVLSADRPEELRGTGANQSTRQTGLFSDHLVGVAEVEPQPDQESIPQILQKIDDLFRRARGREQGCAPGPIQLNVCFRDPLIPEPGWPEKAPSADEVRARWEELRRSHPAGTLDAVTSLETDEPEARDVGEVLSTSEAANTVVLAGHGAGEEAAFFALRHGLPLLAEPNSNARFGQNAVSAYPLLLAEFGPRIERVVVFGHPTLSRPVASLMNREDIQRAVYAPRKPSWFEEGKRNDKLIPTIRELGAFAGEGKPGWLEQWREASADAEAALQTLLAEEEEQLSMLHVADAVWDSADGNLVLGASNAIRAMDMLASNDWHPIDVYANRGLAGIDGTLATAQGIAIGSGIPTRVLTGDLTFFHDLGSLVRTRGEDYGDVQIVVVNDSGGGIFDLLEHGNVSRGNARAQERVERYFGTPVTAQIAPLAQALEVDYTRAETALQLLTALNGQPRGLSIVEVPVDRGQARRLNELAVHYVLGEDPVL